jgi:serine/threonine protein kinase
MIDADKIIVGGNYQIKSKIGEGSFGEIFQGIDLYRNTN